ncbi:unnamed protein product, partial [Adineta steineri]
MIIRSIRYASSSSITKKIEKPVDDYTYCINSVRKADYENFLCTGLLRPSLIQRPAMAIRALNVELALIRDQVSNTQIGQMRLQFWQNYLEQSITPTYYLLLELAKQRTLSTDHIASHLGRSQGLINIVRGIPYNAHKRRCLIPLSYLNEHKVSQQDIINGQFSNEQFRQVIYQLCNRSCFHLQKTIELFEQDKIFQKQSLFSSSTNSTRSLFLPIIVIYD